MIDPPRSAANLRRLAAAGLEGDYGFFDAIDYTHARGRPRRRRRPTRPTPRRHRGPHLPGPPPGHDPGRAGQRAARRSDGGALPRRPARAGHRAAAAGARAAPRADDSAAAARRDARRRAAAGHAGAALPLAAHGRSRTRSSCRTATTSRSSPTPAAAAASAAASRSRKSRRDPTRDPGSQFVYLRDVRSGSVWSATYHPTAARAGRLRGRRSAPSGRRSAAATTRSSTQLDIAVSTEDDVEVRRLTVINQGTRIREIDVTSYAEIVLAPPADDLAHPAFGKLFLETEYLADSAALLCHRRPRDPAEPAVWAVHVLSLEGRPQGPVEWETDRARFLGRGRDTDGPAALDGRALSGTTGVVLDPIVSLRQRIRLVPGGVGAPLVSPPASPRIARRPWRSRRSTATRARRRARSRSPSRTRRAACATSASRATRRCCSSAWPRACSTPTARCARARRRLRANELGQAGLWPHGISGDLPILLVRVVGDDDVALVRQVLQAQEYWRLKGLSADVVILNEHPIELPRRDARAAHGAPRQRAVADVEAPTRRRLPAARRSDRQGGAHAARGAWRGRSSAATAATSAPSSTGRIRSGPAGVRRSRPPPRRSRPARRSSTRRSRRRR